jgi:hypothetical protein
MAATGGANTVNDGLVFAYDTGNALRSYRGEPTTNLLPNAPINALPTFGNGWLTYNTNQYNGAQYFSIGTIASVSNNIVTTTANHPIRSFDVLNPQTTGGGLTAGTNYTVRKISNTQFSLHAYNSSQDGSQGYINLATGGFKVHDSYWLDERVPVNATDFPTMWWGSPHLPNSAIVKEIIPGGFDIVPTRKTDCIRLHSFRTDATDGMAYGVDAPLTVGEPTTVSFWARAASQSAVGQHINFSNYNYSGPAGYNSFGMTATWGALGEWVRNSYTFTPTHNAIISYWFPSTGGMKVDIANIHVEHKSHRTAFTTGTRSSTQGLLDMTGNSTIDLSNVSFNSNSQITFDGTDDEINTGITTQLTDFSCEVVFKNDNSAAWGRLVDKAYTNGFFISSYFATYGVGYVGAGIIEPNSPHGQALQYDTSKYNHFVVTRSGTTHTIYLNGSTNSVSKTGSSAALGTAEMAIGAWHGSTSSQRHTGEIPVVRLYNRALTADEVQQNFESIKNRFNI